MANRLGGATSPYLLQHADNPVDWWPWSDEPFAEARRREVPILLSVGYSSCHWCHVMAHESFEDDTVAAYLNEHFVSIKVDREERPDVDAVYMEVTQAMTGQGGWPMTCFLTPDGEPFHCGTYFPPSPRPGLPSFSMVLQAVAEAWRERQGEVREAANHIVRQLAEHGRPLSESTVDADALAATIPLLAKEFDRGNGGFGLAPKFPPAMVLEFLLRHHEVTGSAEALTMVTATCEAMARGGMYDQLGGGFARYSVDAQWVVPHFEKMLYDNALLLRVYAHLARRTESLLAHRVAAETVDFLRNELTTTEGAFAASLDADTEGVEGKTYVWTPDELLTVLGPDDGRWAAQLLDVTATGTFEHGTSTLRMLADPDDRARWERVRTTLRAARSLRPQPGRDDKVIVAWNGMAITALAEAGQLLGEPEWVAAAARAADFLLDTHLVDGRLRRTSRHGVAGPAAGVLEDYGCLAEALLALHQATGSGRLLTAATALLDDALDRFADPDTPGAFFDTAVDAERLVRRPSDPTDNATPSGAAAVTGALITASALVGDDRAGRYRAAAESALARAGQLAARVPRFAGHWLSAAQAAVQGPVQVAVVHPDEPSAESAGAGAAAGPDRFAELWRVARATAPGGAVVLAGVPDATGVPLLAHRPLLDGDAAAYVCHGYVCDRPVGDAEQLRFALDRATV